MRRAIAVYLLGALGVAATASHAHAKEPRVVVIDAGHGGRKSGTKTTAGVYESTIVLGIARQARDILEKQGVRVVMTREDDRDVDLDSRVATANGAHAVSAFVSVHSNYAPVPERRGTETYILSPNASDDATEALVHLENDADSGGPSGAAEATAPAATTAPAGENGAGQGDLDFILQDLSKMTAHKDSALLAAAVQNSLGAVRGLNPSRGLRQAPFKVLRGANMPAVLVEIGYLSHPTQGSLLASGGGQKAAGEALARGILKFLSQIDERL